MASCDELIACANAAANSALNREATGAVNSALNASATAVANAAPNSAVARAAAAQAQPSTAAVASTRETVPPALRQTVLDDLVAVAMADDKFLYEESTFIEQLARAWETPASHV